MLRTPSSIVEQLFRYMHYLRDLLQIQGVHKKMGRLYLEEVAIGCIRNTNMVANLHNLAHIVVNSKSNCCSRYRHYWRCNKSQGARKKSKERSLRESYAEGCTWQW